MPSRRHAVLARVVPRVRKAEEMGGRSRRAGSGRELAHHPRPDPADPGGARLPPSVLGGARGARRPGAGFPAYVVTPRGGHPQRTLFYLHGGGFMAPIDRFQVRYVTRLATAIGARVVMPDYPLAPEHSWRDSHDAVADLAARWASEPGGIVLVGDSSGGGYALAVALDSARQRPPAGDPPAAARAVGRPDDQHPGDRLPTTRSTRGCSSARCARTPLWWAGRPDDLGRPEVSPALADLSGLPPGLMFYGTRDLLLPGCRLLARRAAEAGWPLIYVERPGLIHVYPVLPFLPEARDGVRARRVGFLSGGDGRGARPSPTSTPRRRTTCGGCGSRCSWWSRGRRTPTSTAATANRPPATSCFARGGDLVGYARVLDDGGWARIGRVVVAKHARGQGLRGPSWCARPST